MGKKILVIDDDFMNLKMAEHALRAQPYEIILADSGAAGLVELKKGKVDLILLDIEMPEMNGMETLKKIQEIYSDIPVIFLTASGHNQDVLNAIKLGAIDYIKKPFLPQNLLDRVAKVFQ